MSEQELASNCARGEDRARKELYVTYSSRIRALCSRYAADAAEAEDMMQDAFIKIFHVIKQFTWTHPGSLYSWMSRVALNLAFDSAKKRQRLARTLQEIDFAQDSDIDEPGYDETLSIPFDVLQQLIEELPEGYRIVYKLHDIDELSHRDIAELLGIKEKSSAANLSRARAILARNIKNYLFLKNKTQ